MPTLSQKEIDDIYSMDKEITDDIQWIQKNKHGTAYSFEVDVFTKKNELLKLYGNYNIGGEISFRLQMARTRQLVRQFDTNTFHINPDEEKNISSIHKHFFHEVYLDRKAYPVSDIDVSDVNQALKDFLKESRIKFKGTYHSFTSFSYQSPIGVWQ